MTLGSQQQFLKTFKGTVAQTKYGFLFYKKRATFCIYAKMLKDSPGRGIIPHGIYFFATKIQITQRNLNLNRKYFSPLAQASSNDEHNLRSKIWLDCPFNFLFYSENYPKTLNTEHTVMLNERSK